MPDVFVVANVRNAHGLEGYLLVHLETDYPEDVFVEGRVFAVSGGGPVGTAARLTLETARPYTKGWLLKFREITDRTRAELYSGRRLALPRSELVEPAEDEYFLHDLAGMEVRTEDDAVVGRVEEVYEAPSAPLLGIRVESGGTESGEASSEKLVPFRREFVAGVDAERGVIRIRPPAGLLEI